MPCYGHRTTPRPNLSCENCCNGALPNREPLTTRSHPPIFCRMRLPSCVDLQEVSSPRGPVAYVCGRAWMLQQMFPAIRMSLKVFHVGGSGGESFVECLTPPPPVRGFGPT